MVILIPVHIFSDFIPDGEHPWEMARSFAKLGVKVRILAAYTELKYSSMEELEKQGIFVTTLPIFSYRAVTWTPGHMFLIWCLAQWLRRKEAFDAVLCIENCAGLFAKGKHWKIATRALRSYEYENPKLAASLWYDRKNKLADAGFTPPPLKGRIIDAIASRIMKLMRLEAWPKSTEVTFCQTKDVLERLEKEPHPGKLIYLPNGANADQYVPKPMVKTAGQPFEFLFVGRIGKRKGIEYLMPAFRRIHQEFPNTKMTMVGRGAPELVEWVKGEANGLPVEFTGQVPFVLVHTYFQECDVFVLPSLNESFSTSVLKAWACEKPVIFTKGGGAPDYFPEEAGVLVEPADEEALYQAMKWCLEHPEEARKKAVFGRQHMLKRYTWDLVTKTMADALRD